MNLDLIYSKLEIMRTLSTIGFSKDLITLVIYRIEMFEEDIGEALWNSALSISEAQDEVESEQKDA